MNTKVLIKFDNFQSLANGFFRTLGICPYDIHDSGKSKLLNGKFLFYSCIINMNLVAFFGVVLVVMALIEEKNLMDMLLTIICAAFIYTTNIKLLVIILNRAEINDLMRNLNKLFPKSVKVQEQYQAMKYLKLVRRSTITFSATFLFVGSVFVFYSIGEYLIHAIWLEGNTEGPELMYPVFIPWKWQGHWSFVPLYIWQFWAIYTAAVGQIGVELLFYSVATQLVMHYDYVARAIEFYEIKAISDGVHSEKGFQEDMQFLRDMVEYHNKILRMSDILNDVFGVSLFLNFAVSSVTINFATVLMTVDIDIEWRLKLALSVIAFSMQIYFITFYGQLLIDASTNVSYGTFRQNWANADRRYQKLLSLIIQRSQRPAFLNATNFVTVEQTTMTLIFQVAYRLVCVLRKMLTEN